MDHIHDALLMLVGALGAAFLCSTLLLLILCLTVREVLKDERKSKADVERLKDRLRALGETVTCEDREED